MKVDVAIGADLGQAAGAARGAEADGYDGVWSAEVGHDPFLPLLLVAEHSERVELGTGIAVAFARNPMILAHLGHDLQAYSRGRFLLGLGSQVKPHVEKRYSMPWSHPARRMRELVLAVRAIWDCWENGTALDFRGEFYRHTLMTPFFNPGPTGHGVPKLFLAAVGERMTEVAGEVADGMLAHPFTTERYLREVTVAAVARGMQRSGRRPSDFQLSIAPFVVTGNSEHEKAVATAMVRQQIAFYGSTPAYRPVLELHGWGDLQGELNQLSKQGRWEDMAGLVDDEVVAASAVRGEPHEVARLVWERFGDLAARVTLVLPFPALPGQAAAIVGELKATSSL